MYQEYHVDCAAKGSTIGVMKAFRNLENLSSPRYGANPAFRIEYSGLETEMDLAFSEQDNKRYFPIYTDATGPSLNLASKIDWEPRRNKQSRLAVRLEFPEIAGGFKLRDEYVETHDFNTLLMLSRLNEEGIFLGERVDDTTEFVELHKMNDAYKPLVQAIMTHSVEVISRQSLTINR